MNATITEHPLVDGCPPAWASAWGQDGYGPWVAIEVSDIEQRLRWIPPGRFDMGSPEMERGRSAERERQRKEYIRDGFWLFSTPCTQDLWQAVAGDNPSRFQSPSRPVERVSWEQANQFCAELSQRIPGAQVSLPSEVEWEYACRAGTTEATYAGDLEILGANNAPVLDQIAWYGGNAGVDFELDQGHDMSNWPAKQYDFKLGGTHPVGLKKPNPWGLWDMLGNVWEWCSDVVSSKGDPVAADAASSDRVIRGGSWNSNARHCRAAFRCWNPPSDRSLSVGFRCRVQEAQLKQAE